MNKPIEFKLPSGSALYVQPADFDSSKAVYQAVLKELRNIKVDPLQEIDVNLYKDTFCVMLSSKAVEEAIMNCMDTVLVGSSKTKLTKDYFIDPDKRQDYLTIMYEVGKVNIEPFMKSLYAQFGDLFSQMKNILA